MTEHNYKYYLLAGMTPVRVAFNDQNHTLGAEVPDPETKSLRVDYKALHRVEQGPEVDDIDKGQFDALCQQIYAKKKTGFNGPG